MWRPSSATVSFLRPLARRAANTRRPLAVAILSKKPCLLRRLRCDGWNVRFISFLFLCLFDSVIGKPAGAVTSSKPGEFYLLFRTVALLGSGTRSCPFRGLTTLFQVFRDTLSSGKRLQRYYFFLILPSIPCNFSYFSFLRGLLQRRRCSVNPATQKHSVPQGAISTTAPHKERAAHCEQPFSTYSTTVPCAL